ncbi:hypothetical protein OKA05_09005 [Luteolibacter arcticus]|uniref:Uncharacterized protein n=1 Tax=Luteolibacter arcticus TaxID=1581411 RepID=A0ABT3GGF2_9BACT|nr:hypothetical protein [Luteolibacter arcticus]MCW1922690.1 hypothetical protein [Luteolibacter arcticus]
MSDPLPRTAPESTASGQVPVELYAGPLCGTALLAHPSAESIRGTCPMTGAPLNYIPSELRSLKGCRIYELENEIPF